MTHQEVKIAPLKLMLLEDDADDQELFEQALARTLIPSELFIAGTYEQLFKKLNDPLQFLPDMIFLDINMPGKNGKECLMEIKSRSELKNIPCIMLSASDFEKDIEDSYNAGASLYVPKPESFLELIKMLKDIIMLNWEQYDRKSLRKKLLYR